MAEKNLEAEAALERGRWEGRIEQSLEILNKNTERTHELIGEMQKTLTQIVASNGRRDADIKTLQSEVREYDKRIDRLEILRWQIVGGIAVLQIVALPVWEYAIKPLLGN